MLARNHERGLGLLELMLSLSVLAVILLGILHWANPLRERQRVQVALQQVALARMGAARWQAMPASRTVLSVGRLIEMGLLTARDAHSPWGGEWDLSWQAGAGQYCIRFVAVPAQSCARLANVLRREGLAQGGCDASAYMGCWLPGEGKD